MPNCDFYGLNEDHNEILNFILSETGCSIYEMYSRPGCEVRLFTSDEEVLALFNEQPRQIHLNLYSPDMGGEFIFRRLLLDKEVYGDEAFRFHAHGWGAIQLYLGTVFDGKLEHSHTNHNTEKRALNWTGTIDDLGSPFDWNWKTVSGISGKINRFIRKQSVSKQNNLVMLPNAVEWRNNGGEFW